MMNFRHAWTTRALVGAAVVFGITTGAMAEDVDLQKVLDKVAPALVNVKYIVKFGDTEREVEISGVMIEPNGLVLCPGRGVARGRATATNLKILAGEDEDGVEAKILARDSE